MVQYSCYYLTSLCIIYMFVYEVHCLCGQSDPRYKQGAGRKSADEPQVIVSMNLCFQTVWMVSEGGTS